MTFVYDVSETSFSRKTYEQWDKVLNTVMRLSYVESIEGPYMSGAIAVHCDTDKLKGTETLHKWEKQIGDKLSK